MSMITTDHINDVSSFEPVRMPAPRHIEDFQTSQTLVCDQTSRLSESEHSGAPQSASFYH